MNSAPYIRPGRLRCRAELQSRTEVADGYGGVSVTWTKERDVWCAIRERSAKEQVAAMREQSSVTHEIWTRYASDITADKRLVYGGVAYNIRGTMNPEARNEFLRVLAESGVAT